MHWSKCITNVFTSEKRGTFKILFQPLYFRGQDRISNFLYIPTKFLLKIAFLKNYTTMALFLHFKYTRTKEQQHAMLHSLHAPANSVGKSLLYSLPCSAPYIKRCISLTFRKCQITWSIESHEFRKKQISWFHLTFKILGFDILHQFKMNDIYFA